MLRRLQEFTYSLATLVGLAMAASPAALAQTAPVVGDHYAARASDTGFAGSVNSSGGYGASVPLALPGAKGGLPVPVHVVNGGNRFGAAGLGWDVPLSYIRHHATVAHRRPVSSGDAAPQARDQYSLMLDGSIINLVRMAENEWRALRGTEQLKVRDMGGGAFEMYDGNGLKYSFSSDGGDTGHPLDNGNLYLLRDISGPGGAHVQLDYALSAPSLGGGSTGLSIDLKSVSYNFDADDHCSKHIINLHYDANVEGSVAGVVGN